MGSEAPGTGSSYMDGIMLRMLLNRTGFYSLAALLSLAIGPVVVSAQAPPQVTLPTVTVTAQKEPADPQQLPVSLSLVPLEAVWNGGMTTIGDASIYAPNTYFSDFTARKLSNPRFRGIGSSPANPAITTNIDGVPQLNSNSSSIELLDVSQVEFLDSAGVHALFRMLTTLQTQRKRLVVVAPHEGRVRRLLDILDLPSLAPVCDTRDEAIELGSTAVDSR